MWHSNAKACGAVRPRCAISYYYIQAQHEASIPPTSISTPALPSLFHLTMAFRALLQGAQDLHAQFHDILEKTDFSLPTFLAFGAALQLLIQAYLPLRLSATLPLLWLAYCLVKSAYDSRDVFRSSFTDVKRGRFTTRLPEAADGVVVFVLGARLNQCVCVWTLAGLSRGVVQKSCTDKVQSVREAGAGYDAAGRRVQGHVARGGEEPREMGVQGASPPYYSYCGPFD